MAYCADVIAEYVVKSSFEGLPGPVVLMTKNCIRDSIGCSLGGSTTDIGKILLGTAEDLGKGGPCTLVGSGMKTSPPYAAFVNGTLADILELNDIYRGHLGATIVGSALAVAEMTGASGKDIINACSAAYEVSARIGAAVSPVLNERFMGYGFGTYQTFGAVAAAGSVLGLTREQLVNALGIAGANAPLPCNIKTVEGSLGNSSMVKNNFGSASLLGVLAAMQAKRGFTGPRDIFDGDNGFWKMYGSDRCDFDELTEGLGSRYLIMNMGFKKHASCGATHGAIDAVEAIMAKHGLTAETIDTILVKTPSVIAKMPWSNRELPGTMYEAQFSMAYTVSLIVTDLAGTPGPDWYAADKLTDARIRNMMAKVRLVSDDECNKLRASGVLLTKVEVAAGNRIYTERVEFPRGHVKNPLSRQELEDKFKYLAGLAVAGDKVDRLNGILEDLEHLRNIGDLIELLY